MGYKSRLKIGFLLTAIFTPLMISNLLHPLMVAILIFCGGFALTYYIAADYVKDEKTKEMGLMIKGLENIGKIKDGAEVLPTLALWAKTLVGGSEYYLVSPDEVVADKWAKIIKAYSDEGEALLTKDPVLMPTGVLSVLFFPLIVNEKVDTYLILASDQADKFKPYHIKLLEPLANMAINIRAKEEKQRLESLWEREVLYIVNRAREAYRPNLEGHGERVADLAVKTGKILGLNSRELRELEFGALLHDIGEMALLYAHLNPDDSDAGIASLDHASHPVLGAELFSAHDYSGIREAILYHHEHYDGTGYPEGLSYTDIPLTARIVAVADVYDALTYLAVAEDRKTPPEALEIIKHHIGAKFDPLVVVAFEDAVGTWANVKGN